MFWSILFFVVIIYVLGLAVLLLAVGRLRLDLETHVAGTGVGLAAFAVLAVLLDRLHIPLTWRSYLGAGCVLLVLGGLRCLLRRGPKRREEARPFWTGESVHLAAAAAMAAVCFALMLNGAFSVPWLTDDDSWEHATSAKYIAVNHTYSIDPEARAGIPTFLEPYPPGYPVVMGVLHQLNSSILRTFKFFNALIVSLGVLWFYLMCREWTQKASTAIWMTGVIWVLPCFMSHFIWAQSMALVLFFPAFYALERTRREPAWAVVAAIAIGGICLTQPSSAAIFGLMAAIYWLVNLGFALFGGKNRLSSRTVVLQAAAGAAGLVIAAAFFAPAYVKFGHKGFLFGVAKIPLWAKPGLKLGGTSHGTTFGLWDFVWAPANTKINQPTGVGIVLFCVLVAGTVLLLARRRLLKENRWRIVALLWLVFTVLGIEGNHFPVRLLPHRFWAFFAIPVAMIAGLFLDWLSSTLGWKRLVTAVAVGAALAAILMLGGVAGALHRSPWQGFSLVNWLLIVIVGGACAGAAGGAIGYALEGKLGMETAVRFLSVSALVLGVMLTSGYVKARFEGFSQWPWGVRFYTGMAVTRDGRRVPVQQHLQGYLEVHRKFPPNTRMLNALSPDDHLIGFDMYAPPYDTGIRSLREELNGTDPFDIGLEATRRIVQTARRKGLNYVLLDPYWVAHYQYKTGSQARRLRDRLRQQGITDARFQELLAGRAQPTEKEKPVFEAARRSFGRLKQLEQKAQKALERVSRLRELLKRSADLRPVLDSGRFGTMVFEVKAGSGSP